MFEHQQQQQQNDEEFLYFLKIIKGNYCQIKTPFGKKLILPMNFASSGKCIQTIENLMQKTIKPLINTYQNKGQYTENFTTQLFHYTSNSILHFFNTDQNTFSVFSAGYSIYDVYTQLTQLLRLQDIVETLFVSFNNEKEQQLLEVQMPVVFVSQMESIHNVLTWHICGIKIVVVACNQRGELDYEKFTEILQKYKKYTYQVFSFSATSNLTCQEIKLHHLRDFINDYRKNLDKNITLITILDASLHTVYNRINLQKYNFIDILCFEPSRILGGQESSGIFLIKQQLLNVINSSVYKQRYKERLINNWYFLLFNIQQIIQKRTQIDLLSHAENTKLNFIAYYKAAITLEYKLMIDMKDIKERLKNTTHLFKAQFKNTNDLLRQNKQINGAQLQLFDQNSKNIFCFNINNIGKETDNHGYKYISPDLVVRGFKFIIYNQQKALNDLFGIQAISTSVCTFNYQQQTIQIFGMSPTQFANINQKLQCFTNYKQNHLRFEPFFSSDIIDITYMNQALTQLILNEEKLYALYTKNQDGNILLNGQSFQSFYHFSLKNMKDFESELIQQENRSDIYENQLQESENIFQERKLQTTPNQTDYRLKYKEIEPSEVINQHSMQIGLLIMESQIYVEEQPQKHLHPPQHIKAKNISIKLDLPVSLQNDQQKQFENNQQRNVSIHGQLNKQLSQQGQQVQNNQQQQQYQQHQKEQQFLANVQKTNKIDHQVEKNQQNLKEIFNHYCEKIDDRDRIPMVQFWRVGEDFKFLDVLISKHDLSEILRKNAFSIKGLLFQEFQLALEDVAKKIYIKNTSIPTLYDKTEHFLLNIFGIDDKAKFKNKLSVKSNQINENSKKQGSLQKLEKPVFQGKQIVHFGGSMPNLNQQNKPNIQFHQQQDKINLNYKILQQNYSDIVQSQWDVNQSSAYYNQKLDLKKENLYLEQHIVVGPNMRIKKVQPSDDTTKKDLNNQLENNNKKLNFYSNEYNKIPNNLSQQLNFNQDRTRQIYMMEEKKKRDLFDFLNTPSHQRKQI